MGSSWTRDRSHVPSIGRSISIPRRTPRASSFKAYSSLPHLGERLSTPTQRPTPDSRPTPDKLTPLAPPLPTPKPPLRAVGLSLSGGPFPARQMPSAEIQGQSCRKWRKTPCTTASLMHVAEAPGVTARERAQGRTSRVEAPALHFMCSWSVTLSCSTLCDPADCGPPGCSVHGVLPAGTLEWVAISFPRGSSRPRDQTHVSWGLFTTAPPGQPSSVLLRPHHCISSAPASSLMKW